MKKEYILPLRDLTIHPGLTVPIYVDNPMSILCIESAMTQNQKVILTTQHTWNYPLNAEDVFAVGTIGDVAQVLRMPDGGLHCIIRTTAAVNITDITASKGVFTGVPTEIEMIDDALSEKTTALREKIAENLQAVAATRKLKLDKLRAIMQNYPLPAFVDSVVQLTDIDTDVAVKILETNSWFEKLVLILEQLNLMGEIAKIDESINRRVQQQMEGGRRDMILQEKLSAIQKEMGDDSDDMDSESLKKRIDKSAMPADAKEKALGEWKRMRNLSPMSNEGGLLKTYLDELLSMPWGKSDKSKIDLQSARSILDYEHFGMQPVKERILEQIAVMKKTGNNSGSVLCLVGAPGVGKTSLGKSIAAALGRKYHRISLGGISDESHFRGHRKTYIGSQPGRIMDALKRCKSNNPVIVLDEIDKMGRDHRGDPESALLEILDPEQNRAFRDHYLETDFDLSSVLFITTANTLNMSSALKDRMEIIEIAGYTEDEKIEIAKKHLLPRAARDTGWNTDNITLQDDAIRHIIQAFTSESGVRELQRELTTILRRTLLENDGNDAPTDFTKDTVHRLLSVRRNIGLSKKIGFGIVA